MSSVTIITPTYNKHEYLPDAGWSVASQSYQDWEWWIILDGAREAVEREALRFSLDRRVKIFREGTTEKERAARYRPAAIANKYLPQIKSEYQMWLSDDDILHRRALEVLIGSMTAGRSVVFGRCQIQEPNPYCPGAWDTVGYLPTDGAVQYGLGTDNDPYCRLDGGQVLIRQSAYRSLGIKWPETFKAAKTVDGTYLSELARFHTFHPVEHLVVTHRRTHKSTHFSRGVPPE